MAGYDYLEIARRSIARRAREESSGTRGLKFEAGSSKADAAGPKPSNPQFWGAHGDEFGWRLNCAWDVICRDYLAGMIAWLETNEPLLYERITRNLPDKISSAWNAVPFSEFDLLCHELEAEHGRATDLYRQDLRASEARRLQ